MYNLITMSLTREGYIYKYCLDNNCYYGFTKNPDRRKKQHEDNLKELFNKEKNSIGDFEQFVQGSNKLSFDRRYYKMFAVLVEKDKAPKDFEFEVINQSHQLSGGGLIEKNYAKKGLFNGSDKTIGLKKESFWDSYKSKEEVSKIYLEWRRIKC